MLNQEIIVKRLALIKHLYKMGLEQSQQIETIASFSILSFHDSIEMFLKLLAEHKDIKSDKFNFADYWTQIPTLTLKESMKNLNARRVNIKHKGLLPSKSDIEISRVNTTDFFEQNTQRHFNIDFKDISLLSLIKYDEVRSDLEKAQEFLNNNKPDDSIENAALAFAKLLNLYEDNKTSFISTSPFFFGQDLSFQRSHDILGYNGDKKMGQFIDKVTESIERMQKALKLISLGFDYKKYVKFKLLTPIVTQYANGDYFAQVWNRENKKWTKENCQYCIDFVLDCALKLHEFDFNIDELEEQPELTIIQKTKKENKKKQQDR